MPLQHYMGTKQEDKAWQFLSSNQSVPVAKRNIDQLITLPDRSKVYRKFTEDEHWMVTHITGQLFKSKVENMMNRPQEYVTRLKTKTVTDGGKMYTGIQDEIRTKYTESAQIARDRVKAMIRTGEFDQEFETTLNNLLDK
jgi:rubrerythrin